jgi:hypothetical protein
VRFSDFVLRLQIGTDEKSRRLVMDAGRIAILILAALDASICVALYHLASAAA